ncbi:hypothetical protein IKG02_01415 [Candidatus Saccharibacteria bacterium]|nr:hypothetical protein [Candidatus Saccharibacteria bacterium]
MAFLSNNKEFLANNSASDSDSLDANEWYDYDFNDPREVEKSVKALRSRENDAKEAGSWYDYDHSKPGGVEKSLDALKSREDDEESRDKLEDLFKVEEDDYSEIDKGMAEQFPSLSKFKTAGEKVAEKVGRELGKGKITPVSSGEESTVSEDLKESRFEDVGEKVVEKAEVSPASGDESLKESHSEDTDRNSGEELEGKTEFGGIKSVEFKEIEGESAVERAKRDFGRKVRKMTVALAYGAKALLKQDFDFGREAQESKEVVDLYKNTSEEEFNQRTSGVLSKIETPYKREGAGEMYEKIKDNPEMLKMVFSRVPEAWSDMPEAHGEPDAEGQKRISMVAIDAFMKKYPTALEARNAENEYVEDVVENAKVAGSEDAENGEVEKGLRGRLKGLSERFYGAQAEYLKVAGAIWGYISRRRGDEEKADVQENEAEGVESSDVAGETEESENRVVNFDNYRRDKTERRLRGMERSRAEENVEAESSDAGGVDVEDGGAEEIDAVHAETGNTEVENVEKEASEAKENARSEEEDTDAEDIMLDRFEFGGSAWVSQVDGRPYSFDANSLKTLTGEESEKDKNGWEWVDGKYLSKKFYKVGDRAFTYVAKKKSN